MSLYLTTENYNSILGGKKICVFGAYKEAISMCEDLNNDNDIVFFIDNYKNGSIFRGKCVISLDEYNDNHYNFPIIIASRRSSKVISNQLVNHGLRAGEDFWVWDGNFLFHENSYITEFINQNKKIWQGYKVEYSSGILTPMSFSHDVSIIIRTSYFANYMSEKYKARIIGYGFAGCNCREISDTVKKVYNSFNVENFIDVELDNVQQEKVNNIVDDIWPTLNSWTDWKRINIYGIHFGTTMIRHFFREKIPVSNMRDEVYLQFLYEAVSIIVFWFDYILCNDIKIVLMIDGTHSDGYLRDIAIYNNIPAYSIGGNSYRLTYDFAECTMFQHFDLMWKQLSQSEQNYGIEWAKKRLAERLLGSTQDVNETDKKHFAFTNCVSDIRVLKDTNKLKVLICPHSFEEDSYWYGPHLFDDNYYSWLRHLGELSNKTDYEWYLKPHPSAIGRDPIIIDNILSEYPNIIEIKGNVSPIQLSQEGIKFAFTESGTIGHEYPALGIQVINAGYNPHSKFDFCWNPSTIEEFDNLVYNIPKLIPKDDMEGLLRFYALRYLYYDWDYTMNNNVFFENDLLKAPDKDYPQKYKKYELYVREFTYEKHDNILKTMPEIVRRMDEWKPYTLYKRRDF